MYTYCPYCMSIISPGYPCQGCGKWAENYKSESHHFPMGELLNNRYYIGRVLGEGGFGITYLGIDTKLERKVAIKEYFPRSLVRREVAVTLNVTCYTGSDKSFEKGREQFLKEARTLAKLDDIPEIVQVLDFFPANNSAYIVMEFLEGTTLKDLVSACGGCMPSSEVFSLFKPVLSGMEAMHASGLIHRDISPDNLMLLNKNRRLKLMDFGCARELDSDHTMTVMLKPGFAPPEQYTGHEQGPWSDVYGISATMYYCLTGVMPPEAMRRIVNDPLIPPSNLGMGISEDQENALLKGLNVNAKYRFRSIAALHIALYGETTDGMPIGISNNIPTTETANFRNMTDTNPNDPTDNIILDEYSSNTFEENSASEYISSDPFYAPHTEYLGIHSDTSGTEHLYTEYANIPNTEYVGSISNHPEGIENKNHVDVLIKKLRELPLAIKIGTVSALCLLIACISISVIAGNLLNKPFLDENAKDSTDGQIIADTPPEANVTETKALQTETDPPATEHIHAYGEWSTSVASTCTTEGEKSRKCSCGDVQIEAIEKTAHTAVIDYGFAATCTSEGKTEGSHCSVCGNIITPQETVPILPHNFIIGRCASCNVKKWQFDFAVNYDRDDFTTNLETIKANTAFYIHITVHGNDPDALMPLTYTVIDPRYGTGEDAVSDELWKDGERGAITYKEGLPAGYPWTIYFYDEEGNSIDSIKIWVEE